MQDANEFLTELLRICQLKLTSSIDESKQTNAINQYFGIEYDAKYDVCFSNICV